MGAIVLYLLNGKVQVKPNWTGKVATVLQMIAIGWVMLQFHFLSAALCGYRSRHVHVHLRNRLRRRRSAPVASRRPCACHETVRSTFPHNERPCKLPAVAIVGRPNVGKSALFNRLIRRKIAIVHDQPGITRDRISAVCASGTRPFVLWDTGGIFGAGEAELTAQVRRAAEEAFCDSDLLLFVVDAKEGLSPIDAELARLSAQISKARGPGDQQDRP